MRSCLYIGQVMHRRLQTVLYHFVFPVFQLYVGFDELPQLHRRLRLFSHNRFNLYSLHDRDHGPRDGRPLRPWLDALLAQRGIALEGGTVYLLCFPRVLGYVFNPMCVWYCHHRDGSLRAVVCEVRNTFGEMHHYVLTPAGGGPMAWQAEYRACKVFHVSPFIGPEAEYRFSFSAPGRRLRVFIDEHADGSLLLQASIASRRVELTDAKLLAQFLRLPFMTLQVMARIHWQALKIWARGAKFYRMPERGLYPETDRVEQ